MSRPDEDARRAYWTASLDAANDLMEQVIAYRYEESGEVLGSIPDAMTAAGVEVQFSDSRLADEFDRLFYIREGLLPYLINAAREMNEHGWILKIEDGFRTQEMQTRLGHAPRTFDQVVRMCVWECHGEVPPLDLLFKRARAMVAQNPVCGTHTQGAAVDISVYHRNDGSELCRGKPYLEMSEITPMKSPFITAEERTNREQITEVMERHGFMHYPGEFWHYNQGDVLYQLLVKSDSPGRYGPVHWDMAANTIAPYDDPYGRLTDEAKLESLLHEALARIA